MIRHFGAEPPWRGTCKIEGRRLKWRLGEPLWDGTPVWELEDRRQPTFLDQLTSRIAEQTKVAWLEDDFLPVVTNWVNEGIQATFEKPWWPEPTPEEGSQ